MANMAPQPTPTSRVLGHEARPCLPVSFYCTAACEQDETIHQNAKAGRSLDPTLTDAFGAGGAGKRNGRSAYDGAISGALPAGGQAAQQLGYCSLRAPSGTWKYTYYMYMQ